MVEVRLSREGDQQDIIIQMEEVETINSVKEKLSVEYGIPIHCQRLKQRGTLVGNHETLTSLRQQDSPTIALQLDVRYVLTIEVYTGSSFELEVSSTELVDTLISTISRQSRVSFYRQEIMYDGTVLQPGRRISDYGIPDQAVLVVNLRNYEAMVFVKTLDGKTIVLTVRAHDTVAQVKEQIERQEGIAASKQRLIFVGEQLRSDFRFLDYHIEHESAVHLVLREGVGFEIYVDAPSGKNYVLEVEPNDSLDQLKEKLRSKENIPCDMQRIFLGNNLLSSSCSLSENGVQPFSDIRLALDEGSARVNVALSSRSTLSLWVRLDQTVSSLKEIVAERERVTIAYVELYYARTLLENHHPLSHYRIRHNQTIHVNVLRPLLLRLVITVRGNSNTQLEVQQPENDTVLHIKENLSPRVRANIEDLQLFLGGSELDNEQTLSECGIRDRSNLDLIISQSGRARQDQRKSMHLFVKTLTGKTVVVDVDPTDTIQDIKEQICAKERVPVPQQCLVIGGRILQDSVVLSECGVQNQSVLHLVLRVPSQSPINVTVQRGETDFQLAVMQGDTVNFLKEQIEGRTGIPRLQMNLVIGDQVLDELNSLADYNLEEGTVVLVQDII